MKLSEIKKEALESLKGKWKKAVCITLAFLAISMFFNFVQEFLEEDSTIYNIVGIVYFIINVPLSLGLLVAFMKLKRDEDVGVFDFLKEGFSRFGKAWGIWFHTFIKLLLPIICLVLATILMVSLGIVNALTNSNWVLAILSVVLFIITMVYVSCKSLLYVIAYNISFDNPELSSKKCVLKSAELMKGNRWKYFVLGLSFFGWAILVAFTFGIGILWLMPYMQVSIICFYEKVLNKNAEKVEE